MILLTATQDICVDGWSLTLFGSSNVIWQSISQMIGQPFGSFIGSPILLTFESANMTNRLIRQPLGLADQSYGLFTLAQFLRFWGIIFLITTSAVTFLFREKQQNINTQEKDQNADHFNLLETYLYILRLFKKKCFRQLLVILLGSHIGFVATYSMTFVILIR
jgi:PAT family acetyl-CoA transporter-like MFS transporter 1